MSSLETPKQIVAEAYNNHAVSSWYSQWVQQQSQQNSPRERLAQVVLDHAPTLTTAPEILDIGCGPGLPVLPLLLAGGARVVANDLSQRQLELAMENVRTATEAPADANAGSKEVEFILGDMATLEFELGRFDGIVSFYTLFHLPRAELGQFLRKVFGWVRTGGVFAFNLACFDEEEIFGEVCGQGMFWSSFGEREGLEVVREAGFEVVSVERGEGSEEADEGAEFLWVVARRPG